MKAIFRNNGLTIVLSILFLFSLLGMLWSGHITYNEELREHGLRTISVFSYIISGDFLSALFENWESEFLQMAVYVILTAMLFQRGSAESRDPDNPERPDDELQAVIRKCSPLLSWFYTYSLGITLSLLFLISFTLHWWGSFVATNDRALRHGAALQPAGEYFFSAQLWFESFQNWQSEFMSTATLVVLSIFLRHRGSPESKPIAAANSDTGT